MQGCALVTRGEYCIGAALLPMGFIARLRTVNKVNFARKLNYHSWVNILGVPQCDPGINIPG